MLSDEGAGRRPEGAGGGECGVGAGCCGDGGRVQLPFHTSAECKLMAGDTATFNAAMRNAKDPDHPPGGCTRVNGQDQWETQAMTAHSMVTASANPHQNSAVFSDDEYDLCSETDEFLANLVFESFSPNDKAYLEPDSDPTSIYAQMACNDGYLQEDDGPVQITAHMVSDDLLFGSETDSETPKISAVLESSELSSAANIPNMHPSEIPLSYIEAFKANLKLEEKDKTPYRPIHKDLLPDPTLPTFKLVPPKPHLCSN